jgi:predicted DCC family thiol-disulfide oxidoreductase YuxK
MVEVVKGADAVDSDALTVLYDGACPLCRREISVCQGLQPLRSDRPVCFSDVSDSTVALPESLPQGVTREQLLSRFHVRDADGKWLSGARAFLALWAALPGWRWLAKLGRVPGMVGLMEVVYRLFLRFRPTLQSWMLRLAPEERMTRPHRKDAR